MSCLIYVVRDNILKYTSYNLTVVIYVFSLAYYPKKTCLSTAYKNEQIIYTSSNNSFFSVQVFSLMLLFSTKCNLH